MSAEHLVVPWYNTVMNDILRHLLFSWGQRFNCLALHCCTQTKIMNDIWRSLFLYSPSTSYDFSLPLALVVPWQKIVMPARATVFDKKCKPLLELGEGPYNTVRWNPKGKCILFWMFPAFIFVIAFSLCFSFFFPVFSFSSLLFQVGS